MKTKFLPYLLIALLVIVSRSSAAEAPATVTEVVNHVSHGSSQSANSEPAKVGTQLSDGEYLKTGAASRAEMQLSNQTITRLGANTIFNYSASSNTIDLEAGTMLFSKPKDAKQMTIKTAAVTAAIVGTTGFVKKHGDGFLFGLVEGTCTVTINGAPYTLTAGEILTYTPPKAPQIFAFNVPLFIKTSKFFTDFDGHLPNQRYIDREIAEYNNLVDRGFIQPPQDPFYVYENGNGISTVPTVAIDSAGNSLNILETPPGTPPTEDDKHHRHHPHRCCYSRRGCGGDDES
jgi:hypothetical protein